MDVHAGGTGQHIDVRTVGSGHGDRGKDRHAVKDYHKGIYALQQRIFIGKGGAARLKISDARREHLRLSGGGTAKIATACVSEGEDDAVVRDPQAQQIRALTADAPCADAEPVGQQLQRAALPEIDEDASRPEAAAEAGLRDLLGNAGGAQGFTEKCGKTAESLLCALAVEGRSQHPPVCAADGDGPGTQRCGGVDA